MDEEGVQVSPASQNDVVLVEEERLVKVTLTKQIVKQASFGEGDNGKLPAEDINKKENVAVYY